MGFRQRPIALTALAGVAIVALAAWFWWATTPDFTPEPLPADSPVPPRSTGTEQSAVKRAVHPPPPPSDYVGDQACVQCHEEEARKFATSSMAHSLSRVHEDSTFRTFPEEVAIRPGGKCVYRVRQVGTEGMETEGMEHDEQMFDQDGQLVYEVSAPVHYSMGSGKRGRSYIANHGGILSMSSISWYANGNRWDLSPGYVPDDPRGFGRRVLDECLGCHAGRVATLPGVNGKYALNPFPQLAIGCENCHGPGKQHVEARAGKLPANQDTIVNPAKLPLAQRDSVCNQCHLQGEARIPRYGRTYFDFRPGQRLEETLVVFLSGTGVADGKTESVRHVQQMMASRCYSASEGKLGCISCHDAHATVAAADATHFYRVRCLTCHEQDDCHAPAEDREVRQDSCFGCHMPRLPAADIAHTAQTDHRVLARPQAAPKASNSQASQKLLFFDKTDERLPPWEVTRASGLAVVKQLLEQGRVSEFSKIESLLAPVLEVAPDDTRVMNALTELALKRGDLGTAEIYARRALEVEPQNEAALVAMTLVCYQTGRYVEGLELSDRALAINPTLDTLHAQRADMLRLSKRLPEGIEAAVKALQINPRLIPVREWLVHAYRDQGQAAKSAEQMAILRRMEAAPLAK
jgi:hypothetical protein